MPGFGVISEFVISDFGGVELTHYSISAEGATYTFTGSAVTFDRTYILAAEGATYAFTGQDASLQLGM